VFFFWFGVDWGGVWGVGWVFFFELVCFGWGFVGFLVVGFVFFFVFFFLFFGLVVWVWGFLVFLVWWFFFCFWEDSK